MSTLTRYILHQVPGWVAAAVVLTFCELQGFVTPPAAIALFAAWVVKDIAVYPFVRRAYEPAGRTRVEDLIGSYGEVQRDLTPAGFIRIRGELWRAEVAAKGTALPVGSTVVVRGARGLTLIVELQDDAAT